jgi:integrase
MSSLKLTKSAVEAVVHPATGQVLYYDTEMTGFGLRVGKVKKTFFVEGRHLGKNKRLKVGSFGRMTVEEARKEAKSQLFKLEIGEHPREVGRAIRAKSITLEQCFEHFKQARKALKERTLYDYGRCLDVAFEKWKDKPLIQITKDMVQQKHAELGEARGQAYANLSMRFLRALFNFATGQYEDANGRAIIPENPVRRLSQTRSWYRVKPRTRVIKAHELKPWLRAVMGLKNDKRSDQREVFRDYLLFILFTGLRREEAAQLKWENVDFNSRTFKVIDTKNRDDHELPITKFLYELLRRRQDGAGDSTFVFSGPGEEGYIIEPRNAVRETIDASGVAFTIHDLRRTFITIGEGIAIPPYALKRLVNHRMSGDVTAGYISRDVNRLRVPLQKIEDYILTKAGMRRPSIRKPKAKHASEKVVELRPARAA